MTDTIPVEVGPRDPLGADLLAVGCLEGEAPDLAGLGEPVRAAAARLLGRPGWAGRDEQAAESPVDGGSLGAVALYGLGKRAELTWRKLAGWLHRVTEAARINGHGRLALLLPEHPETAGSPGSAGSIGSDNAAVPAAERILRALALAGYRYSRFLSQPGPAPERLERVLVLPPAGAGDAFRAALATALPVAGAVAYARQLGNTPSNEATPPWFEERARELAASHGLALTVLGRKELEARGMGGLIAVGAGSEHEPRLLRLDWGASGPTVALVGKGVTFDTGGVSIKTAADMDEMKYDKCGACNVLGIARAAVDLALPVRLRLYLAIAENVTDGRSYRPGDIIRCYNGRTVETVNTDAEGRLMLADAMAWAAEEEPDALLELSTLTGACVAALGRHTAGLFTPDDRLAGELAAAGEQSGERLWRLPLGPEYLEEMKGAHADLRNSATRWGAASGAAAFLSQFVGGVARWAHLDIAGVASVGRDQNGHPTATGFGVASGIRWLRRLADEAATV
jgi:leucyl aminopeptidase